MKKGKFISFEGVEGSGKSTQMKLAIKFLEKKGFPVVFVYEPGSTAIGEEIRKVLLDPAYKKIDNYCELFLFIASRAQLIKQTIEPELAKGKIVVSDRFTDATICYQGYGSGLDIDFIKRVNSFAKLKPDLTILLDINAVKGLQRVKQKDRIEQKCLAYHQRVREGYLKLTAEEPERIKIVEAEGVKETAEKIRKLLERFLGLQPML
ncbi:MAG: dTMP kinase [Candidatus Omnitrophica bacterium]|nr:dTMP kinase [Candidatus Omnitrophota bacterium]